MKQPSVRLVGFSLFSLVASDRELPQASQELTSSYSRGCGSGEGGGDNSGFTACSFVSGFVGLLVGEYGLFLPWII